MSGVQIDVNAQTSQAERDLAKINQSLVSIEKQTNRASQAMANAFRGIGTALFSAGAVAGLVSISNEFTQISNKIGLVTGKTEQLVAVQEKLADVAEETRSTLSNTADVFSSFGKSLKDVGAPLDKIIKATKAVQQAVTISGSAPESAKAALMQLGQGLSAGALRGEELNSVIEQTPRLAQAIADELGVSVGKMRILAADGKLVSSVVFDALLHQAEKINKEFDNMTPGLAQGFGMLKDQTKLWVNEFDKGVGASAWIGRHMASAAKYIKESSKSAHELGTRVSFVYNTIKSDIMQIARPMGQVFANLGKQLIAGMPKLHFTRTLKGDIREAIRTIDKEWFGGALRSWSQFKFIDVFTIESDVELAVRALKRLSPQYWAAGGMDVKSISQFFSKETLNEYTVGFQNLAVAVANNLDSIGTALTMATRRVVSFYGAFTRYMGFKADTLIRFTGGTFDTFFVTLSELTRGIANASVRIWQFRTLIVQEMGSGFDAFKLALRDAFERFPEFMAEMFSSALAYTKSFILALRTLGQELISFNPRKIFSDASSSVDDLYGGIFDGTAMLDRALDAIKRFGAYVIEVFFEIWDAVIGHSWWTDTIDDTVEMAQGLLGRVKGAFTAFKNFIVGTFRDIQYAALKQGLSMLDDADYAVQTIISKMAGQLMLSNAFSQLNFFESPFEEFLAEAARTFKAVSIMALVSLNIAAQAVENFSKRVIYAFFKIWDEVIGHSWWTDTVENIQETSTNLWDRCASGLNKFKNNTIKIFRDVFQKERSFDFKLEDLKDLKLEVSEIHLPKIQRGSFFDSLVDIYGEMQQFFSKLFEAFPTLLKAAIVGTGGIVVAAMFPPGKIKTALLAAILTSLSMSGTLIAEKFGAALTGGSFVYDIGYKLGTAVGSFVSIMIRELPSVLNAIFGFLSSFIRGFAEQLPVIGSLIAGIFSTVNALGMAGPLGLFGVYFFGRDILNFFKKIELFKGAVELFEKFFGDGKPGKGGQQGGFFNNGFFGALGAVRTMSFLGLALDYLGVFDSIFASSVLAQYATTGGLLYLALIGKGGLDKITDWIGVNLIAPVFGAIKNAATARAAQGAAGGIFAMLFSGTGSTAQTVGSFVKAILDATATKIVSFSAPLVKIGYDFMSSLFLGKDPKATASAIKASMASMFATMASYVAKTRTWFMAQDVMSTLTGWFAQVTGAASRARAAQQAQAAQSASLYQTMMALTFSTTTAQAAAATATIQAQATAAAAAGARIGGDTGLLGRMFFGKNGKFFLVGGILAAFSAIALASDSVSKKLDQPLEDLKEQFAKNKDIDWSFLTSWITWMNALATVAIPGAIYAFFKFNKAARESLSGIFDTSGIKAFFGSIGTAFRTNGVKMAAFGTAIAGTIASGLAAYKWSDDMFIALMVAQMVGSILFSFRKQIQAGISWLARSFIGTAIAAIATAVVSPIGLIISGLTVAGGLLGVLFFGKKGEFWDNLEKAFKSVAGLVWTFDPPKAGNGLSQQSANFANSRDLGLSYKLDGINMKRLEKGDQEKLSKRLEELEKAIQESIDEEATTGRVSNDTRAAIAALNRNLVNYSSKLAVKTSTADVPLSKIIEQNTKVQTETYAQELGMWFKQNNLDFLYQWQMGMIKFRRWAGNSPDVKRDATEDIDKLQAKKDTVYNARYRPLTDLDEYLMDYAKQAEKVEYTNEAIEKRLAEARQGYELAAERYKSFNTGMFGQYKEPDNNNESQIRAYLKLVQESLLVGQELENKVKFDQQYKAIQTFNKSLGDIKANLKEVSIEFDTNELFAADEYDFERLKNLSVYIKELGEQLKQTSNISDQNQIKIRIIEARSQVEQIQNSASIVDPTRKQFKLREMAEKAGIKPLDDKVYLDLSDEKAEQLYKTYVDVANRVAQIKIKPQVDLKAFGTTEENGKKVLRGDPSFRAPATYEQEATSLEAMRAGAERLGIALAGPQGQMSRFQESLQTAGVDLAALVKKQGYSGAIDAIERVRQFNEELQKAEKVGDTRRFAELTVDLANFKETLTEATVDINSFVSSLSGMGKGIQLEDLVGLSDASFNSLRTAVANTQKMEKDMAKLGDKFSKADIDRLVQNKLQNAAKAFRIYLSTIGNTAEKTMQILSKFGVSTNAQLGRVSGGAEAAAVSLEIIRESLADMMSKPGNAKRLRPMVAMLARADELAEQLKDKIGETFGSKASRISSVLDLGLTEGDLAKLPTEMFDILNSYAAFFQKNLEKLRETGKSLANETPEEFYKKFDTALRKLKFVSHFSAMAKSLEDIGTDGLKPQFDKLTEAVGNLNFDVEAFATLSREQRAEFVSMAVKLKAIQDARNIPGLSNELLRTLSTLNSDGSNADSVLSQFMEQAKAMVGDNQTLKDFLTAQAQVTPYDANTQATINNTSALQDLQTALNTLQWSIANMQGPLPLKRASGGWIRGAGTGTSDSIPAMLSHGEFVVNAASSRKYGDLLESLNGGKLPGYYDGGFIDQSISNTLKRTTGDQSLGDMWYRLSHDKDGKANNRFDAMFDEWVLSQDKLETLKGWMPGFAEGGFVSKLKSFFRKRIEEDYDLFDTPVQAASKPVSTSSAKLFTHMIDEPLQDLNIAKLLETFPDFQEILDSKLLVQQGLQSRFGDISKLNINKLGFDNLNFVDDLMMDHYKTIQKIADVPSMRFIDGMGDFSFDHKTREVIAPWLMSDKYPNKRQAVGVTLHELGHSLGYKISEKMTGLAPDDNMLLRRLGEASYNGDFVYDSSRFAKEVIARNNLSLSQFADVYKDFSPRIMDEHEAWAFSKLMNPLPHYDRGALSLLKTYHRQDGSTEAFEAAAKESLKIQTAQTAANIELAKAKASGLLNGKQPDVLSGASKASSIGAAAKSMLTVPNMKKAWQSLRNPLAGEASALMLSDSIDEMIPIKKWGEGLAAGKDQETAEAIKAKTDLLQMTAQFLAESGVAAGVNAGISFIPHPLAQMIARGALFTGALGYTGYKMWKGAQKKATGGEIFGPGSGTSDSIPAWLSNGEFVVNAQATKKHRKLLERINTAPGFATGTATASDGKSLDQMIGDNTSAALAGLVRMMTGVMPQHQQLAAKSQKLNIEGFDPAQFLGLDEASQKKLVSTIDAAYDAMHEVATTGRKDVSKLPKLREEAEKALDEAQAAVEDLMIKYVNKSRLAGRSFASSITESWSDALRGLATFKADGDKSVWTTFRDKITTSFSDKVMSTFMDGLLDPLTGEKNGILTKGLRSLGSNLFNFGGDTAKAIDEKTGSGSMIGGAWSAVKSFGGKAIDGIKNLFGSPSNSEATSVAEGTTEAIVEGNEQQRGLFGMLGDIFSKGWSGLAGILQSVFPMLMSMFASSSISSGLSGLFGTVLGAFGAFGGGAAASTTMAGTASIATFAATGGHLVGPGTGTSDSIPAMLSNGEFIVNAAATKANLSLLHAINAGNIPKFASGGLVSSTPLDYPVEVSAKQLGVDQKQVSSTQTIQLNITGDVSRQTRAEIAKMIPHIATGVNSYNREKG